jgi:hypothetical protein
MSVHVGVAGGIDQGVTGMEGEGQESVLGLVGAQVAGVVREHQA